MAKVYFSRQTVLSGMVIRSTVDSGIIDTIKLPPLGGRFLTVEARDIRGDNRVKIGSDSIPLLSSNQISYKGQAIIALFGPDIESVELKAKEADISYRLAEAEGEGPAPAPIGQTFGDFDNVTADKDLKTYSQSYDYQRVHGRDWFLTRVSVGMAGNTLHVICPTQWPLHVRDTISEITTIPKKQIIVHRQPFYAPHDEMLIRPSLLAAIAALACLKGGYPVEIMDRTPVWRPEIRIKRKSYFTSEGKPVAEDAQVTIDQGAWSLFREEMAKQVMAGLVPPCDLKAMRMSVSFQKSDQVPAAFYGDLGYSTALASTEEQYSQVAALSGINPDEWREQYYSSGGYHDQLVHTSHTQEYKESLADLVKHSDFSRKFNVYQSAGKPNKNKKLPMRFSSFFGYARGIALSSGVGIAGFSYSEHKGISPLQVQVELRENDKVTINTSFYGTGNAGRIWRQVVSERLGVPERSVTCTQDSREILDSGPSVLASNSGKLPLLIQRACDQIKEKRFVNPLPLVETVTDSHEGSELFVSDGWASVVVEVVVDTVTFVPMVKNVWASVLTGRIYDAQAYREKIRHTIVTTLLENGAHLAEGKDLQIEIVVKEVGEEIAGSLTSAVKGLTMSSFASALDQAVGADTITLPVTSSAIIQAMNQRRPQ